MSKSRTAVQARPARPVAQQKRSARTEGQLLEAAMRVLDREGLDGATVPRIAAEAGLAAASIYRRYADKDDLLRAALLGMLEANTPPTLSAHATLAETAEALISTLLKRYREHPHLLRALTRMLEAEPDAAFTKEATWRMARDLEQAAEILLAHRDHIRHPEPERAARFAILAATSAIEVAALDQHSLWRVALPLSDRVFIAELTRQTVAYLRRKP